MIEQLQGVILINDRCTMTSLEVTDSMNTIHTRQTLQAPEHLGLFGPCWVDVSLDHALGQVSPDT